MVDLAWGGYANGRIPAGKMTMVRGERFEPAAGTHLRALETAFQKRFGKPAIILEGYRSLTRQRKLWNAWQACLAGGPKANLAAVPGTSNHGFGRAADFASSIDVESSAEHKWMVANAPAYGWHNAGDGFSPREPWHFEYWPGTATAAASATPIKEEDPMPEYETKSCSKDQKLTKGHWATIIVNDEDGGSERRFAACGKGHKEIGDIHVRIQVAGGKDIPVGENVVQARVIWTDGKKKFDEHSVGLEIDKTSGSSFGTLSDDYKVGAGHDCRVEVVALADDVTVKQVQYSKKFWRD